MKRILAAAGVAAAILLAAQILDIQARGPETAVYFSPHGGCTGAIVAEIAKARRDIRVQAYLFTSRPIAKALIAARKRGVAVHVLLDRSQRADKSQADELAAAGVAVLYDEAHAVAHDKVMIVDRETVVTGSFNFTRAAEESNGENVLVIRSKELAGRYLENWQAHREHSTP